MRIPARSIPLLVLLALAPGVSLAADSLVQRIDRLERRANVISKLVLQIQRLEREVQQQQGRIESLQYQLKRQEKRNRDLYQDLDRRLGQRAAPAAVVPAPVDRPAAPSPSADDRDGHTPAATRPSRDTPRRPAAPPVTPGPASSDAESAYQQAFNLLRQRDYPRAAEAFRGFLQRYPDAALAENAWYWLGETHYAQNQYPQALKAFARVIDKYPFGTKVPGALLKTGFIHAADGDLAKARAALSRVVEEYPSSAVAPLAKKKLAQLRR